MGIGSQPVLKDQQGWRLGGHSLQILSLWALQCPGRAWRLRRAVGMWHSLRGGCPILSMANRRSPHHQANPLSIQSFFKDEPKQRAGVFIFFIMAQFSCHLKKRKGWGQLGGNVMAFPSCGPEQACWRVSRNPRPPHQSVCVRWLLWLWKCDKTLKAVSN